MSERIKTIEGGRQIFYWVDDVKEHRKVITETRQIKEKESRDKTFELFKATTLLLSDRPQKPVDVLFFFGRSYGDAGKRDLFGMVVELYQQGMIKHIVIPGTEGERQGDITPYQSNPGKTCWTKRMVDMGIPREVIHYSEPAYNTKTEGDAFLKETQKNGWKRAVAITQPHQITRAMLGLVKTINDQNLKIDVYAAVPAETDWHKKVKGSQGKERKPRIDHMRDEYERVFKYQEKGDLASFDELFSYMEHRNLKNTDQSK